MPVYNYSDNWVRFEVLTAKSMKITVLKDVALCSPVDIDRRFRGDYYLNRKSEYLPHYTMIYII
jgi:hypothetical protein